MDAPLGLFWCAGHPCGADGGVDIRCKTALAQVKYQANFVGRPALQQLVGARGRKHDLELLFFSGTGFSARAVEYAKEMGIALFTYRLDGHMVAVNQAARRVHRRVHAAQPDVDDRTAITGRLATAMRAAAARAPEDERLSAVAERVKNGMPARNRAA